MEKTRQQDAYTRTYNHRVRKKKANAGEAWADRQTARHGPKKPRTTEAYLLPYRPVVRQALQCMQAIYNAYFTGVSVVLLNVGEAVFDAVDLLDDSLRAPQQALGDTEKKIGQKHGRAPV